ncbi:MAG: NADH-quinone oxidoreductase subunit M, partial [Phenylobacterium sp.]|uniref:NADH-quinone oxidoreductase subunit M n=1 Tax=Phenylobacterium sp. TaxID=1871053 RepID=UPI002733A31D
HGGSFDILTWHTLPLGGTAQTLIFFAFLAAFAVKVPMWPVHTWLPDVHVEAPTGGSAVLAAIMLKLGAYGFLRFSMPIAPDAAREWAWLMIALSLIAVIYVGLVPMFLIIGVWGGARRVYAAFKFFLYTLLGSVLMLAAILAMIGIAHTSSIPELMAYKFAPQVQTWLWLAFFASFAVKMPMWPVHTWLPDAHVEAPTAGSVILAGILLKLGGYGFMRFSLPMFPQASEMFAPLVFALSVIAIVYTSLVAFRQVDIKKLIAYSSVAHMGFVTMGIFSGNAQGEQGALFQMLSHGVISGALFLCVGVVYDRMHTREIAFYGGLVSRMPWYAAVFMLFTMGNVGLPGTSGFVGEILTMAGTYEVSTWTVVIAATGVIFSAVYALSLYRRVVFGEMTNPALAGITDLDWREVAIFTPLVVSTLVLGVHPSLVFDLTQTSVDNLASVYRAAIGR